MTKRMNSKLMTMIGAVSLMVMLTASPMRGVAQKTESAETLLQTATKREVVDGDLAGAVEIYKKAIAAAKGNKAVAASALLRLADVYQKMGNPEAQKTYEQILRDYPEQKDAGATAKARLAAAAPKNTGVTPRQVWTGPKVNAYGGVSQDGRYLSFTDWDTGDLAIHDFMTGQNRRLTNKASWNESQEYAIGSAISPDGKQIAYGWRAAALTPAGEERFEVRLIDMNGGKPRVLTSQRAIDFAYVNDWSLDGKWLAVTLGTTRTSQIALISTVNGDVRVLKSANWNNSSKIAFSPDGKYLAYDLAAPDDADRRELYVMSIDGGRESALTPPSSNERLLGWLPSGRHLLFVSSRSGLPGVWAVPIADGKPQGAPQLVKANFNPGSLGITRAGVLYCSLLTGGRDIFVASIDLEAGKVLTPSTVIPQPYFGVNDQPRWSPDGKYLAYFSSKNVTSLNRERTILAIRSMETGKVRELRPNLAYLNGSDYSRPIWADAASFIVAGADKQGRQGIFRIDAETGNTIPIIVAAGKEYPIPRSISPDGRTLTISRPDPKSKQTVLFAHNLATGAERELARAEGIGDSPTSPDGRWLAFTMFNGDVSSLVLMEMDGWTSRELQRTTGPETLGGLAMWSADSKSVFFRKFPDGAPITLRKVFRISIDGGAPKELGLAIEVGRHPNIHPDGRQVTFTTAGEPNLEIWALENLLPASR